MESMMVIVFAWLLKSLFFPQAHRGLAYSSSRILFNYVNRTTFSFIGC
jgi:hypothetical protein